jgi:DNA polymerase (family X)
VKEPINAQIAEVLERIADLLEAQDANPFRVRAYREGAQTIRSVDEPVADFVRRDQIDKLKALPSIGDGIAAVIGEYVSDGKSDLLEQLEAEVSPEEVFGKVPGIGEELAQRIVEHLHIQTLPELEEAVHDGRLATVEGFGAKRIEGVRTALAGMLSRSARSSQRNRQADAKGQARAKEDEPSVELLLEIDADYRSRADADKLPKIAPRRFNPDGEAWLPVLHTKRDGWAFTALFSNTAQAHKLEKTQDWVVIYYERDGNERQNTVVTETQGPLKGKRVVRGRNVENQRYYSAGAKQ